MREFGGGTAMPIRFRCVYCDKLLGIAKRKAGAVVNCPQCQQPLIVPTPEPEPPGTETPDKLFERDDIDDMLDANPDQTYRGPAEVPIPAPVRNAAPPAPFPTIPQNRPAAAPRTRPPAQGIVLTTGHLVLLVVVILVLAGGAFAGGYMLGKG
jgi:phage FluMu protein Com